LIFKDLLKTNPEIAGMTGSSAGDVVGIGRAVEEAGLQDKIAVVGTSIPSYAGDLLKTGAIDLAMAWDPGAAGYACNRILQLIVEGKPITDGMNLGLPAKYPGFEKIILGKGPNGVPLITGAAWIKITTANMADYPF
jgi:simple sugar transport system substrate-binding protein